MQFDSSGRRLHSIAVRVLIVDFLLTLFMLLPALPVFLAFTNACCCVTCEVCSGGQTSQYQIEIAGVVDGTCAECENMNATFIANFFSPTSLGVCQGHASACTWFSGSFSTPPSICPVQSVPDGHCVELFSHQSGNILTSVVYAVQPGGSFSGVVAVWQKDHGTTSPIQCNFSSTDIPYQSSPGGYCDASASTCTVTSI